MDTSAIAQIKLAAAQRFDQYGLEPKYADHMFDKGLDLIYKQHGIAKEAGAIDLKEVLK